MPLFCQIRELIRSLGYHILNEAIKYGTYVYGGRGINNIEKDLKTTSVKAC